MSKISVFTFFCNHFLSFFWLKMRRSLIFQCWLVPFFFSSVQIREGGFVERGRENCHFNSRICLQSETGENAKPSPLWKYECVCLFQRFCGIECWASYFFLKSFNETVRNSSSLGSFLSFSKAELDSKWSRFEFELYLFFPLRMYWTSSFFYMSNVSHKAVPSRAFDSFPIEREVVLWYGL